MVRIRIAKPPASGRKARRWKPSHKETVTRGPSWTHIRRRPRSRKHVPEKEAKEGIEDPDSVVAVKVIGFVPRTRVRFEWSFQLGRTNDAGMK